MPTYDYRCNNCKHTMELFQSMKEAPQRKCPKCGKNALERLIGTGAAVLFKGSGFYQTDYRSESYKKSAEAAEKPSNGESSTEKPAAPEKKPDSQPAKAAETVKEPPSKAPAATSSKKTKKKAG